MLALFSKVHNIPENGNEFFVKLIKVSTGLLGKYCLILSFKR